MSKQNEMGQKNAVKPVDEVIVDVNAIGSLVLRQRQSLIAVSKHYVRN